jgi:glutamyl-tRNA synthetase/glutamyl-Q tRNA(Asp) synthetase
MRRKNDVISGVVRTRFAPAPTGYLHLGHVLNAIHVWGFARSRKGRVVLRIEDHDAQRARRPYEDAIEEDLAWLGFEPDERAPRQSERHAVYVAQLTRLEEQGLVYGCACTRQDVAAASGPPAGGEIRYPGTCRNRQLGLDPGLGWRIRLDPGVEHFVDDLVGPCAEDPSERCGDLLIRDRLGNWTYQWCAAIDDYLQNITHVIRGVDLLSSTARQIRLARLAGRPSPAVFGHHPLIMKSASEKLSKSDGDTGVGDLRRAGWSPSQVIEAAWRAGTSRSVGPLERLS